MLTMLVVTGVDEACSSALSKASMYSSSGKPVANTLVQTSGMLSVTISSVFETGPDGPTTTSPKLGKKKESVEENRLINSASFAAVKLILATANVRLRTFN